MISVAVEKRKRNKMVENKDKNLHEAWTDFVEVLAESLHIDKVVEWLDSLMGRLMNGRFNKAK